MSKPSRFDEDSLINDDLLLNKNLQSKKKPRFKLRLGIKFFLCCVVAVSMAVFGGLEIRQFVPYHTVLSRLGIGNWRVWEFHDYFGLDPNEIGVVWDDRRIADLVLPPEQMDQEIFFSATFVREHIDPFMFWDQGAGRLFVSTDYEVTALDPRDMYPAIMHEDEPWVSFEWLRARYPSFAMEYHKAYNMIVFVDSQDSVGRAAEAIRSTPVRYRPNRSAYITQRASSGALLTTFGEVGDYIRVRTSEGLLGYVLTSHIRFTEAPIESTPVLPTSPSPNINLTWEMVTIQAANNHLMTMPFPEGLHVVSPTWFNFNPDTLDGDIIPLASREYVEWAHAQGVAVWPKIFDTNRDISHAILTNYQARERAITQLINFVEFYDLDGINVNFEHIRFTDGGYYVQFLRELAPEMRRIGAVLSVATFVPAPWFSQYHHDLVGKTVDFVAIMTYDEHYSGSEEPGPVASLPFVERSVQNALALIPREKILMGLPFYNRLWRVDSDGIHSISNHGMAHPWTLVEEWGVIPVWDPVIGSYYANFATVENGEEITYRIWLECERSIEAKLRIFAEHDLAGVASWRRGLETQGVWDLIDAVILR